MVDFIRNNRENWLSKLENYAEIFFGKTRRFLPHVARVCLVSTFLDDGYRLISQWNDQVGSLTHTWNVHVFFIGLFLIINIVTQFAGSGLIICRYRVKVGCSILMFNVIFQLIGYKISSSSFLLRASSLIGSLLLLLAESNEKVKSYLAGLPDMGSNKPKQYMLLGGRLLVILIFLTLIHWNGGIFYLIQFLANLLLIVMVAVGYKTKLCSIILVAWLTVMNIYYNDFWNYIDKHMYYDYLKYDFFQTYSVIGGLLLIVVYGPGGVSVDDYKKDW